MIDTGRTWSRPAVFVQGQRLGTLLEQRLTAAAAHGRARLLSLLWWPFEAGNDLPALWARGTDRYLPDYIPERNGAELVGILQRVRRRVILQRLLILGTRTLWLALLVALVLMLGRFFTAVSWIAVVIGAGLVILLAALYHRLHPVTVWTTARLLDRHWRLHEQVATAVELAVMPTRLRLAPHQVLSALEQTRAERASRRLRPRLPVVELQMAAAIGLLVAGLNIVAGPAERLTPPVNPLSPETQTQVNLGELGLTDPTQAAQLSDEMARIAEQLPYGMTDQGVDLIGIDSEALRQAAELSSRSARELEQIAEALKDASVTSQAAQEIQAGNYQQAAEQIADLARAIENLSPEARKDLSERLKQAGQNVEQLDPELARRLEQASKALASRSDRAAAQGLEDLSKAINEAGKNVIPQSQLAEALEQFGEGSEGSDDGPPSGGQGQQSGEGGQPALGAGEAGEFGFDQSESALAIGASAGAQAGEEASSGAGAGQGTGPENEQYTPRLNPNAERLEVKPEQASGPNAPRLGRNQPGAPDLITTGPGATGPGTVSQSNQPISTGLDPNRVPRSLRSVIEGYFRGQK